MSRSGARDAPASGPRWLAAAGLALGGCHAVPPPPIIPMHVGTAAEPRGTTTAMLILGIVQTGDFLFSSAGGVGLAVRVEHQAYEQTALGVQLGGGRGDEGEPANGPTIRHTLVALEGYGRRNFGDRTAATYGAGLSWLSTGLWTLSGHAGFAASFPNDYAVPVVQLSLAGTVPIVPGDAFGYDGSGAVGGLCFTCEGHHPSGPSAPSPRTGERVPTSEWFVIADLGLVVPVVHGNRVSLDLGYAVARDQRTSALSIADAQR